MYMFHGLNERISSENLGKQLHFFDLLLTEIHAM